MKEKAETKVPAKRPHIKYATVRLTIDTYRKIAKLKKTTGKTFSRIVDDALIVQAQN